MKGLSGIFLPASNEIFVEELVALWQGNRKYEGNTVLRTLKGRPFDVLITIVFEGHRCEHTLVIVHDISAIKESERALRFAHEAAQIEIEQREQVEQTKDLLLREVQHRVKNTISMMQVLASKTYRSATREEHEAFAARLQALAGAYDLLSDQNWHRAHIASVVEGALRPFREGQEHRFEVSGPDAWLEAQKSVLLAMITHELATNALKYGGLSNKNGTVNLTWQLMETENGQQRVKLEWQETGGPSVAAPKRAGFGTRLIKQALRAEGGRVRFNFAPDGAKCILELEAQ